MTPPPPNNQVPELADHDVSVCDPALFAALTAAGTELTEPLPELAVTAGSAEIADAVRLADAHPPVLRQWDRGGNRVDEIEVHPAWHALMRKAVEAGLQAAPWAPDAGPRAHLQRAAGFYLWTQTESGHLCPISMTYAAVPALRHEPELARLFEPGLRSRAYHPAAAAPAAKAGLLAGMSMTEKQGGSDLRAATTAAVPAPDDNLDGASGYRITGQKWFTSAPTNDLFLTIAQAPGGLGCFLIPRILPDGTRNAMTLLRLKDKLGNRSNASAEVSWDGALGWRVGPEGRGVATILDMVTMTRLDCVLGSAGQLRAALSQAAHYAARRFAFGRLLIDQPAMTAVLADLAVESWAATVTAIRLADLVDTVFVGTAHGATRAGAERDRAAALLRLALPVAKFWVCKRAVPAIAEALECFGGNGFVETYPMARLLREAPLNGIWEGSGTVTALDALRALSRSPECAEALLAELTAARGGHPAYDIAVRTLTELLTGPVDPASARPLASLAARTLAASLLIRQAPDAVSELYCRTRLAGVGDRVFGELPSRAAATRPGRRGHTPAGLTGSSRAHGSWPRK